MRNSPNIPPLNRERKGKKSWRVQRRGEKKTLSF